MGKGRCRACRSANEFVVVAVVCGRRKDNNESQQRHNGGGCQGESGACGKKKEMQAGSARVKVLFACQ